jgi:hypothetical protein
VLAAGCLALVGVFVDRLSFVAAGQIAPTTAISGVVSAPYAVYTPSLVEISILVGAVGFVALLYTLAERYLDLRESEVHIGFSLPLTVGRMWSPRSTVATATFDAPALDAMAPALDAMATASPAAASPAAASPAAASPAAAVIQPTDLPAETAEASTDGLDGESPMPSNETVAAAEAAFGDPDSTPDPDAGFVEAAIDDEGDVDSADAAQAVGPVTTVIGEPPVALSESSAAADAPPSAEDGA